jgi:hypothetical protein
MSVVLPVQVHLRWATDLPSEPEDKSDESDQSAGSQQQDGKDISPYITVAVGPAAGVTSVAEKAKHAQWRETFFLNVRQVAHMSVKQMLIDGTKSVTESCLSMTA